MSHLVRVSPPDSAAPLGDVAEADQKPESLIQQ